MSVPNLRHIVVAVRESQPWDLSTPAGLCAYSDAVVRALHRHDPNFLYLKKRKPQNGCYPDGSNAGRAVDAALYVPTGQAMDFIVDAGGANGVGWGTEDPVGKYTADDGFAPSPAPVPPPVPIPEPPPVPVPPVDLGPILARLDQLEVLHGELGRLYHELALRMQAEEQKPLPEYEGRGRVGIFGGSFTVRSTPVV